MLVDALIHPVFRLFIAAVVEVTVGLDKVDILIDHIPDLLDTCAIKAAVAEHLWQPTAIGLGEEMEGIAEVRGSHMTTVDIIAVALVDDDTIRDFHDTSFDTLQLVTGACHLDEQEEVDHRVTGRLTLSHADRLDKDFVEARRLTENDRFSRLTSHTAQGACRRTGTDEGIGMQRQFLHTRLIAQDTALGALTGGVDGQDGQLATLLFQDMDAKLVDTRRLTGTRHTTDAHTDTVTTVWQTFVDHLLGTGLMVGIHTLYQRHGL